MRQASRHSKGRSIDPTAVRTQVTDLALVQKRRKQIVDAAIDLFSQQGFYRTTVQEVANRAGISTGLIYHYARTKEDVLLLSLLSVLESYKDEIPPAIAKVSEPLPRLWAALNAYCRVVDRSREATVLAYRSTKSLPRKQRELVKKAEIETNDLVEACLRYCIERGTFREHDVKLVTYQIVTFAHAWALKHWRLGSLATLDKYIEQGFDFFVRALITPKGLREYERMNRPKSQK